MAEQNDVTVEPTGEQPASPEQIEKKKKKKRDKVRSAWISFVGRILAQMTGAVATISLGLMLVQKYQAPSGHDVVAPAVTPSRTVPVRLPTPGEPSLAVLPLETFSSDADEAFADSMTEALITDLSRIEEIRVVSRTSSMQYKGQRRPLPEIARELGVDFILEGSVTRADGRVRITAQLIHAASDEHLWADAYEHPLRGILALQATVSTSIARSVKDTIAESSRASAGTASRYLLHR